MAKADFYVDMGVVNISAYWLLVMCLYTHYILCSYTLPWVTFPIYTYTAHSYVYWFFLHYIQDFTGLSGDTSFWELIPFQIAFSSGDMLSNRIIESEE